MKLHHLPEDLLIDYKVDKDSIKNKYKNKDKKIKDSFNLEELIDKDQRDKLKKYLSE